MAPTLTERYYCDGYYCYNSYSTWDRWGRWVALAAIILFVLFIAVVFSCFNARRRRARGLAPRYGTGWAAGKGNYAGNPQQYYGQHTAAAPPYSPPAQQPQYTGNTFNGNQGYYGQQSGVELQPPQHAYAPTRGGEAVYEAPHGPPPTKTAY